MPVAAPPAAPVVIEERLEALSAPEDEADRAFQSYERAISTPAAAAPVAPDPSRAPIILPDDPAENQPPAGGSGIFKRGLWGGKGRKSDAG
jgi:hypothetical protein